jgi:hypothetical protein
MSRPGGHLPTKCFVSDMVHTNIQSLIDLGRALHHREAINTFTFQHEDLIQYHLTDEDWRAIETVIHWLNSFCSATTQMSATKSSMLSSTHAIFHGLQARIRDILCERKGLSPQLIQGLTDADIKLSDYYYKFDELPFYLWVSCRSYHLLSAYCAEFAFSVGSLYLIFGAFR